jgi:hypothetical protein
MAVKTKEIKRNLTIHEFKNYCLSADPRLEDGSPWIPLL